jgi:hypothetical protein
MHKFEYRAPRFSVDLPAQLTIHNLTVAGRCREISKEGLKLELRQPLPRDCRGTITLSYRDQTVEVSVRIAHVGARHGGLEFLYESDGERVAVAHLIASLSAEPHRPGPVLLN